MLSVHGGSAVNRGADFVQYLVQSPLAPEQGTGPDTAHRSIKLRLLYRRKGAVNHGISLDYFYLCGGEPLPIKVLTSFVIEPAM